MKTLHFETTIAAPADTIFALIADFANYHVWLSPSKSFGTISDITPDPVCLGTTYTDAGPSGVRYGKVTEFSAPGAIAFEQPMEIKTPLPGKISIAVRYALKPSAGVPGATDVMRDLTFEISGLLKIAQPVVESAFTSENERLLRALKRHVEAPAVANP